MNYIMLLICIIQLPFLSIVSSQPYNPADMDNTMNAVMLDTQMLSSSNNGSDDPLFYSNDMLLEGNNKYKFKESTTIRVDFGKEMDVDETRIKTEAKTFELTWNEVHSEAKFIISNDAIYNFQYELYDKEGNESQGSCSFQLIMDSIAPSVDVYMDDQKIDILPAYINENKKLLFRVDDLTLDLIHSSISNNQQKYDITWNKSDDGYEGILMLQEGANQISYRFVDELNHEISHTYQAITVDTMKPMIHISGTSAISNNEQRARIDINDLNLEENSVRVYVTKEGIPYDVPVMWTYDSSGIYGNITFQGDGIYDVYAVASDKAGNETISAKQRSVIDRLPPKVQILMNKQSITSRDVLMTNKAVNLSFFASDEHLSSKRYIVYKNKQKLYEATSFEELAFFPQKDTNDDYLITLEARDEAGNQSNIQFNFSIHTYIKPITITNNVFQGHPYNKNWTPKLEGESDNYRVVHTMLYKNSVPIPYLWGDEITEDGDYLLNLIVADKAMNRISLNQPFMFSIDKTPPSLFLIKADGEGIVNGKAKLHDTLMLSIIQNDDTKQKKEHLSYVKIDGNFETLQNESQFKYTPTQVGAHEIEAEAIDEAGNRIHQRWNIEVVDEDVTYKKPSAEIRQFTKSIQKDKSKTSTHPMVIFIISIFTVLFFLCLIRYRYVRRKP